MGSRVSRTCEEKQWTGFLGQPKIVTCRIENVEDQAANPLPRLPIVVLQQPTKPLATPHRPVVRRKIKSLVTPSP